MELGCRAIAIGGTADHVHLLAQLHASTPVARLIAEVKGASACLLARRFATPLRWQAGYAAFTVSTDDVPAVERYVLDQKRHHRARRTQAGLELADSQADLAGAGRHEDLQPSADASHLGNPKASAGGFQQF